MSISIARRLVCGTLLAIPSLTSLAQEPMPGPEMVLIRATTKTPDQVVDSIKSYSEEKKWLYMGANKAKQGEVIVIDVRPSAEYEAGHLPFARSMPLAELEKRLADLPADCTIVAYCRGPFCLMSDEAVKLLRAKGYAAQKISDGVSEWAARGLPIETSKS